MQRNQRFARRYPAYGANSAIPYNAVSTANTVCAGQACADHCNDFEVSGCPLAVAYFEIQDYRNGYHPGEALSQGTMFPELARPWSR